MYPKLRIQFISEFSQRVGPARYGRRLNMALVTAPPGSLGHGAAFAQTQSLCRTPADHVAAQKEDIAFQDWPKTNGFCLLGELIPVVRDATHGRGTTSGHRSEARARFLTAQEAIYLDLSMLSGNRDPSLPQWPQR